MCTALDDLTVIKYHDNVRVHYGREPVSDNEYRSALHELIHTSLNDGLGSGIDRRCSLIKYHYRRVCNSGSRDGKKLPLSLGKVGSVISKKRIVAFGKSRDKVIRAGKLSSFLTLFVSSAQAAVSDVLHNSTREKVSLLKNKSQRLS